MIPALPTPFRRALPRAGLFAAIAALAQTGCYFSDEGLAPPDKAFYFPTGLAVSPGRGALYVASSDFDLQYNGGTVNVLDLRETRASLRDLLAGIRCVQGNADVCATFAPGAAPTSVADVCRSMRVGYSGDVLQENDNQILTPSACTAMAPAFAAGGKTYATIGAFASGAVLATNQEMRCSGGDPCLADEDCGAGGKCSFVEGARLFIPVRGDPSITHFDVVDDRDPASDGDVSKLDCAQSGGDRRCSDDHRAGVDPYDNRRNATLPVEPVGLDISDDGQVIATTHQIATTPAVGVTFNDWDALRPEFQFYLTSGVPTGPMEVARVPTPLYVKTRQAQRAAGFVGATPLAYEPGFLVTYNASNLLDLYRYNTDASASPARPFVTRAASVAVITNADGKDSRGLVVDPSAREKCEAKCATSLAAPDLPCLRACVETPLDVFIANRSPPSLLLGRVVTTVVEGGDAAFDLPEIYDVVSLALGPSKVALGHVIGPDGKLHRRIFAVTFESRLIFSYDPEARRVDAVIRTGRGPHGIAFDIGRDEDSDELHAYLYVGHFTDSYLGVVDLDMRHAETFGLMFASIGAPTPPRESK